MDTLVNIALVTYNHAKYIAQAIESVLSQRTDFNFKLIIGEDCSSDGTLEICGSFQRKFPDKILLISGNVNVGLVLNYKRVFDACTGKYVAILEGDDYWTDPYKLQKQVDIMEKDPDIGLVHTNIDKLLENGKTVYSNKNLSHNKPENGYVYNQLLRENFITSITACFRRELFEKWVDYNKFIEEQLFTIDYSIWLELSCHGKVQYINDSTAVYRVLDSSLTNSNEFWRKEMYYNRGRSIKKYYLNKYPASELTAEKVDKVYDTGLFIWAVKLNDQLKALEYFDKALTQNILKVILKPFVMNSGLFKLLRKTLTIKLKRNSYLKSRNFRELVNIR